jgi:serine/threonine protein kinase
MGLFTSSIAASMPTLRDTLPHALTPPASFSGSWLEAGGLERTPAPMDALTDPAPPPDCPRYRPRRVLGRGGSGTVWLVHDILLDREVAMKVLSVEQADSAEARAAFLFEARLAGAINHPGVIPVYDAGMLDDGRCFFTMRHIDGPSLADAISARCERRHDALGLRTLLGLLAHVARVVAHVHGQGMSHRDLKPANILIGPGGEAWLGDWGLGGPSVQRAPAGAVAGTIAGLSGTLHYMAPEQLGGEGRHLGPTSDVYSLGVCLFEILTGTTPHHGATTLSLMFQIRNVDAPDPRTLAGGAGIAPELAALCAAALVRDPSRRHVTAATFAARLEQATRG